MKVSVIVPVYNCEEYLDQCIESMAKQTLKDIEVLLVDDGSTDHSLDIIKKYDDLYPQKIKYFTKENGGQASARNLALKYATGEYIGFVDSDDWVETEMYEKMYGEAKRGNFDVVVCDMIDVYKDHTIYYPASNFENKFRQTPSACNKIFKREIIGDTVFPEGLWYEDFNFTTEILLRTDNIGRVHEGLYKCHCREVSTMFNDNSEKNLDMIKVISNIIESAKKLGVYEKYLSDFKYMVIDHVLITTINRVAIQKNKKRDTVIKELIKFSKGLFPDILECKEMQEMPRNRKIVAILNGNGHYKISKMLLKVNSML